MAVKRLLLLVGLLISSWIIALSQDVSSYAQRLLDSYFRGKGLKFDHHTIYVYDVSSQQKLVYAITEMNMMQAGMETPAHISIFVFKKTGGKWIPELKKFDYYREGSFGQFGIAKDEINIFPLENNQFIFYYEQIKDSVDGTSRAWLNIFGYKPAQLYRTRVIIGETNASSHEVASNPDSYYYWEAESYNFQGTSLDNLYLILKIKKQKGRSPETYQTKRIKIKFE